MLGFVGLLVAGVLSQSHLRGIVPPCGPTMDCEKVTTHASAYWLSGVVSQKGIPVAYFGFLGYLVLTALAVTRSLKGLASTRPLVVVGYLLTAVGTVTSLYLQYIAFVEIKAQCPWCIASAITMVATLIVYALLAQSLQEGEAPGRTGSDFVLAGGLTMALVLSLAVLGFIGRPAPSAVVEVPKGLTIVPERPNVYGAATAPLTIVEFADVCCGACRAMSSKMKEFVESSKGKARLIYRHFPLDRHRMALPGAFACEYAAEKGRFWEYLAAIMATPEPPKSPEEMTMEDVLAAAQSVGLDPVQLQTRLKDPKDPIFTRIAQDIEACDRLGVIVTPTFLVLAPGQGARIATSDTIFGVLNDGPYRQILEGKASG